MSNSRFFTYPIETDSRVLMDRVFAYLQAKITGWTPSEGQLDTWMIEAFSGEAADVATIATQVPKAIFRFFGEQLFDIPAIDSSTAIVNTTWFLADSVGHTIEAGTQFGIRDTTGELHIFVVLSDVAVANGDNQTDAGEVIGIAQIPGSAANDLGDVDGTVELIDPRIWVDHITQTAASSGGEDAESDDDYLDRLALELQAISPRPILSRDFSILARNIAGVQRATTLDNYDPDTDTYDNERMATVIALDEDGSGVPDLVQDAISAYLESLREMNFIVNTMDPTVNEIDVSATLSVLSGYDPSDVQTRVIAAVGVFLDPAVWGMDPSDNPDDPKTWNNEDTINYLDLGTIINNVGGVDKVTTLTLGLHGDAQTAADLTLEGVVPIPSVGDVVITIA